MPAPYAFNGRAGTRLALLRIGTGGRVASHLGTRSDRLLWGRLRPHDNCCQSRLLETCQEKVIAQEAADFGAKTDPPTPTSSPIPV